MNPNSQRIFLLMFVVASLGLTLMSVHASTPTAPITLPKVLLQTVTSRELHHELLFPARVTSKVQTEIYADFEGVVTSIQKNVGSPITRNEAVIVLRNTDPIYNYAPVKILTPVSGVISTLLVTEGTQVKRGQLLATVTDPKKLRIEIEIPAMDLEGVTQKVVGTFESSALAKPVDVKVMGVSPSVSSETGTAPALLSFSCAKCNVRPGILGQVRLTTDSHQGIRIPENAISYRDGLPIVKIVANGVAKVQSVKLGEKVRGEVEVTDGLRPADQFILRANKFVKDGEKVEVDVEADEKSSVKPPYAPKAKTTS